MSSLPATVPPSTVRNVTAAHSPRYSRSDQTWISSSARMRSTISAASSACARRSTNRSGVRRMCLRGGEPDLGAELDDEQVHQQRQQPLDLGGQLGHEPAARLGAGDVVGRVHVGVRVGAEREVASGEPHRVVGADRRVDAAFVPAVRLQQALAEVTDGHLARCRRRCAAPAPGTRCRPAGGRGPRSCR